MIEIIVCVLLMTILFTFFSAATLILRKHYLRGREGVLRMVWVCILILSVTPILTDVFAVDVKSMLNTSLFYYNTKTEQYKNEEQKDSQKQNRNISENEIVYSELKNETTDKSIFKNFIEYIPYILVCVWVMGVITSFIMPLYCCYKTKSTLIKNSHYNNSKHIHDIFEDCCNQLGIKRKIKLRIVNEEYSCSPCTVGILFPIIFIFGNCVNYNDNKLKFIFMHELVHIKHHDSAIKQFMLFVCSIHWFNPISHIVIKKTSEDCEILCDNSVLKHIGNAYKDLYMYTILEVAEKICLSYNKSITNSILKSGLLFNGSSGFKTLERRFESIKSTKKRKPAIISTIIIVLLAIIVNSIVMSSYIKSWAINKPEGTTGNLILDQVLRTYYKITDDEPLTPDMIEGITSFGVQLSGYNYLVDSFSPEYSFLKYVYVDYVINGTVVPMFKKSIPEKLFVQSILKADEYFFSKYSGTDNNTIINYNNKNYTIKSKFAKKILAFHCYRDINQPSLTEESKNELIKQFPDIVNNPGYYLDMYASNRELLILLELYLESGIYDEYVLKDGTFDASCLELLPNLQNVYYRGVTAVNEKLSDGVPRSHYYEYKPDNVYF